MGMLLVQVMLPKECCLTGESNLFSGCRAASLPFLSTGAIFADVGGFCCSAGVELTAIDTMHLKYEDEALAL